MKSNNYDHVEIGINSLKEAYFIQRELLEKKTIGSIIGENEQGDQASKGDVDSEKAVINYLRRQRFPCRVISEEHGLVDIVENPSYLVVLDGIDGSGGLVINSRSRCGTMLAIADNINPTYDQFIFGGITEFITERIMYALKDQGVFLIESPGEHENVRKIKKQIKKIILDSNTKIYVDAPQFWGEYNHSVTSGVDEITTIMEKTFSNKLKNHFKLSGLPSSAAMCIDLISGKVDLVGGVIAKGVFEPPTMYRLIKEINGSVMDLDGKDIGDKEWLEYGRPLTPIVLSSSHGLGKEFIKWLKSNRFL